MANAQLQNATEAVIKTAAVAGLAYAGAYMAAAGTTPGAYDSSRRSQVSSTGQRYCDTREADPLKFKCTAEFFNGLKVDNGAEPSSKVAIRNYWCCPASDLGGQYIGDMNGVCVNFQAPGSGFAQKNQGSTGCVYHGPCASGENSVTSGVGVVQLKFSGSTGTSSTQVQATVKTGACHEQGGGYVDDVVGIFGSISGYGDNSQGATLGRAYNNGVFQDNCCVKVDQGKDGSTVFALNADVLKQPISFCTSATSCPSDYGFAKVPVAA